VNLNYLKNKKESVCSVVTHQIGCDVHAIREARTSDSVKCGSRRGSLVKVGQITVLGGLGCHE
jgi:hypothetical protein